MLRVLIIDDEPLARQRLRQLLAAHQEVEVVGEAATADAATLAIHSLHPDVLFLDIHLPDRDGISLLGSIEFHPKVIFVTANPAHAVEAFDLQAVDYLLKPVRAPRLALAIARLGQLTSTPNAWLATDRICFKTPERTLVAAPLSILALEADGDFTHIRIKGELPLLVCHQLGYYENVLPSPPFLRLGRSLMINREHIHKLLPTSGDRVELFLSDIEKPFLLGRNASRQIRQILGL